MDWSLRTASSATGVLLLSVLDVVPYRLVWELYSATNSFRIDFAGLNLCQNCLSTFQEGLFDVLASLGACFEENQVIFLSKVAGLQECHLSSLFQIFLVADQDNYYVRACECSCVVEPVWESVEGFAGCRVIAQKSTGSATVIAAGDWTEALLASGLKSGTDIFRDQLVFASTICDWLTSQICSFMAFPPTFTIRLPNSTPIVWLESSLTENKTNKRKSPVVYFPVRHLPLETWSNFNYDVTVQTSRYAIVNRWHTLTFVFDEVVKNAGLPRPRRSDD